MTDQQVELEFMHILLDQEAANKGKQQYEDSEYEEYDKETEDTDGKLSYGYEVSVSEAGDLPPSEDDEDDWEDVETDDFE